jgi:NADPH:quinone reductase-like Zn-dependent oxidoreductase/SAM-dependent methyltransferase/acyl carrier protein
MLSRVGEALPEVLRGERDGLEVLFPGGDLTPLTDFYHQVAQLAEVPSAVGAAVERLIGAAPPGRRLRILEAGGGTGTLTRQLLPLVQASGAHLTFTDVGPRFVQAASETFGHVPGMDFKVFDLERPGAEQGFDPGSFDLILADNAVHATRDVAATLGRLRSLLAPGGALLLVEQTARRGWIDLIFGLTGQWHVRTDTARRPDHLLLSPDAWPAVCAEAGFPEAAVLAAEARGPAPISLIVARAPTEAADVPATEETLIVGTPGGLGERLQAALEKAGAAAQLCAPDDLRLRWADLVRAGRTPRRLVHLAGAETTEGEACCRSLLESLQALPAAPKDLVIATRGAVAAGVQDGLPGAPAATLWGFARALDAELPDTAVRRVDLDPHLTEVEAAAALADELLGGPQDVDGLLESEVALRGAGRFVARIAPLPDPIAPAPEGAQLVLGPDEKKRLAFRPAERRAPGPGEVEVTVEATGLGFPDVLQASGLSPLPREVLGYDVAGRVARLGEGVEGFAPGDPVFGLADGAMAQFVCTDARLLVPRPPEVSAEAAAASANAWATVRLALDGIAKLQKGERVLIHSAAGALGAMAVQLARARGCEVFATAHPSKHAGLRRQGIAHPLDSRSADFGRQIRLLTEGQGVAVVLNALTTDTAMQANLTALAEGGRFVELGKRDAWTAERMAEVRPDVRFQRFDLYGIAERRPETVTPLLRELAAGLARGVLKAPLGPCFPAARVEEAFLLMRQGLNRGRPVVFPPALPSAPLAIPTEGSVLITGGLGGLGLAMARRLVERGARHLVLAARRTPTEDERRLLDELAAAGADVRLVQADVSREEDVAACLAAARAEGPLCGLVHAAGTLEDGHHSRLPWARMQAVLAPKLSAAWTLHRLTEDDPLRFFVTFGSFAGIAGNAGQTAHAAASAGLAALMRQRHAAGRPGFCLDLGRVGDVGAASGAEIGALLQARGVEGMESETVLDTLERLMGEGRVQATLAAVDWRRFTAQPGLARQARFAEMAGDAAEATPPDAAAAPPAADAARGDARQEAVRALVGATLGMPTSAVPLDTPLVLLGLDSLMAVDLNDRLLRETGTQVQLTELIGGIAVRGLAERLAERPDQRPEAPQDRTAAQPAAPPAAARRPNARSQTA